MAEDSAETNPPEETKTEQRKGVYASVDQALGPEICQALASPLTYVVDRQRPEGEIEKVLVQTWDEETKISGFLVESKLKYLIERDLGSGRKAIVVADFTGLDQNKDDQRVAIFDVEKLIIKGPEENCVSFGEIIPNGISLKTRAGSAGSISSLKSDDYFWFNSGLKELSFGPINSVKDLASLWHEAGHAVQFIRSSDAERELNSSARRVVNRALKLIQEDSSDFQALAQIEENEDLDYLSARFLVAEAENGASFWAIEEMSKVADILDIDPLLALEISDYFQKCLESYDYPFLPEVGASRLAKETTEEQADFVWEYYSQYQEICELTDELGIKPGEKKAFILPDGAVLTVEDCKGGMFSLILKEKDLSRGTIFIFGLNGAVYETVRGDEKEKGRFNLVKSTDWGESLEKIGEIVELQKMFIEEMNLVMVEREKKAEAAISWLKTVFPETVEIDPYDLALEKTKQAKSVATPQEIDKEVALVELAASPIRRLDFISKQIISLCCRKIGWNESDFLDSQKLKFDPKTGQEIIEDWQRLVIFCEQVVENSSLPQFLPDRLSFKEADLAEKEIIRQAAAILAQEDIK